MFYKTALMAICTSHAMNHCEEPGSIFLITSPYVPAGCWWVFLKLSFPQAVSPSSCRARVWTPCWPSPGLTQVYQCLISTQDWRARGCCPSMAWQVPGKREGSLPSTSWLQCCCYSVGCCWWLLLSPLSPRPFLQSRLAQPVSPQPVPVHGLAPPQGQEFAFVHVEFREVYARPLWMAVLLSSVLTAACGGASSVTMVGCPLFPPRVSNRIGPCSTLITVLQVHTLTTALKAQLSSFAPFQLCSLPEESHFSST